MTTPPHTPGAFARWAPLIGRVLLGGLFCFAAFKKLQDPQGFLFAINGFKILPPHLAYTTAFALPCVEMLAGAMLVLGVWTRAAALVIVALLGAFVLGILHVLYHGYDTKCSCFGDIEWPCTGGVGWCQIVRNCGMAVLSIPVFRWGAGAMSLECSEGKRA